MSEPLVRTFLALEIPEEIRLRVGQIQGHLKKALGGIRWVRPEGMHLTLKFFGDVSAADIAAIEKTVSMSTDRMTSMTFSLGALGTFPNATRPRVLWLGIEGDDTIRLAELQQRVETNLEQVGFSKEKRFFTPHLTLGRISSPGKKMLGIDTIMRDMRSPEIHSFRVDELVLFKSELKPTGALYGKLARFSFGG